MSTHRHSRRRKNHHSYRKNSSAVTRNLPGKLITLVQLLMTVIFIALLWDSGMAPGKYLAALFAVLFILFGIMFGLQFLRNKIYILGIILSVLISIVLGIGTYYLVRANQLLVNVGGATYKTDNMIVVVRADDDAENN